MERINQHNQHENSSKIRHQREKWDAIKFGHVPHDVLLKGHVTCLLLDINSSLKKNQRGRILRGAYVDAAELIAERSLSKPITDIQVLLSYWARRIKRRQTCPNLWHRTQPYGFSGGKITGIRRCDSHLVSLITFTLWQCFLIVLQR